MSMLVCGRPGARGLSSVPATLRASGTEGCVPGTVVMARDERPAALSESGPWRTGLFRASRSEDHEAGHAGLTNPMVGRQGGLITFAPGGKVMSTAWVVLAVAASMFGGAAAEAADGTTANDQNVSKQELLKRLETMERRVQTLETQLKQQNQAAPASPARNRKGSASAKEETAAPGDGSAMAAAAAAAAMTPTSANDKLGPLPSVAPALKFGMYGELKFGSLQNPAANGQWQNGFDAARVVLLPTYQFTDNIVFNAEIEFEHAGSGFDNDDKLHGTAEIEQAFVDFQFSEHLNWRAPGVDLVPISYYNLYHEPTLFYSVNRPELVNGLIPSTWSAGATALYGKIVDGLNYEFQISQSLEDFGDDFGLRTDANTPPLFPQGYLPGIDGIDALANAKAPLGDFRQLNNSLAYTGRLSYSPPFLPGFAGSTAVYYSPTPLRAAPTRTSSGFRLARQLFSSSTPKDATAYRTRGSSCGANMTRSGLAIQPISGLTMTPTRPTMSAKRCMVSLARSTTISGSGQSSTRSGRPFHSTATLMRICKPADLPAPIRIYQRVRANDNSTLWDLRFSRHPSWSLN
jgi:hypothetical protein